MTATVKHRIAQFFVILNMAIISVAILAFLLACVLGAANNFGNVYSISAQIYLLSLYLIPIPCLISAGAALILELTAKTSKQEIKNNKVIIFSIIQLTLSMIALGIDMYLVKLGGQQ